MTTETTEATTSDPSVGATTDSPTAWHQINWRHADMTLDGLERLLASRFSKTSRAGKRAKVNLVRYADDFLGATRGRLC
jgi:hypothetical protein